MYLYKVDGFVESLSKPPHFGRTPERFPVCPPFGGRILADPATQGQFSYQNRQNLPFAGLLFEVLDGL